MTWSDIPAVTCLVLALGAGLALVAVSLHLAVRNSVEDLGEPPSGAETTHPTFPPEEP